MEPIVEAPPVQAPPPATPATPAPQMANGGSLNINATQILQVLIGGVIAGFSIGIGFYLAQRVMGIGKRKGDLNDAVAQNSPSAPSAEASEFAGGYRPYPSPWNMPNNPNFMPHPHMRPPNLTGRGYTSNPNSMTGTFSPFTGGDGKKPSPYANFDFTTGQSW